MQHFTKEFKGYHKSYYFEGFHLEGEMQEEEVMVKVLNPAPLFYNPSYLAPLPSLPYAHLPACQLRKRPEKTGNSFWEGNTSPFRIYLG